MSVSYLDRAAGASSFRAIRGYLPLMASHTHFGDRNLPPEGGCTRLKASLVGFMVYPSAPAMRKMRSRPSSSPRQRRSLSRASLYRRPYGGLRAACHASTTRTSKTPPCSCPPLLLGYYPPRQRVNSEAVSAAWGGAERRAGTPREPSSVRYSQGLRI